jgi:hypothetical protein
MTGFARPGAGGSAGTAATLTVNARTPYEVIAFSFGDDRQHEPDELRLPELRALVLLPPEEESAVRQAEQSELQLICVLDPATPESQIGAFTFMGRVAGFRELGNGRLAAEFASIGPVTPHFLRR